MYVEMGSLYASKESHNNAQIESHDMPTCSYTRIFEVARFMTHQAKTRQFPQNSKSSYSHPTVARPQSKVSILKIS